MGLLTDGVNDRGDLGTLGDFGSWVTNTLGFSLSVWSKLGADSTDSVASLFPVFNHDSVTNNSQSLWWGLNMGYNGGGGIENTINSVLINLGDSTDTGFLYHQLVSTPNFNNMLWHHHCITIKAQPTGSRSVLYYMDGVLRCGPTWTNAPFNDALGTVVDHVRSSTIAARTLTNAVDWFDYTEGEWHDPRIYKRVLTAAQVQSIANGRGRDSIGGYHRRWDMCYGGRDISPNKAALTAQNGASYSSVIGGISGHRRRAA